MNGLANLAWAVMCIAGAALFLVILITDGTGIRRRLGQAGHLLAGAGRRAVSWLARKARGEFASPSRAHPAARAVRGWEHISGTEDSEFEQIAERLRGELPADAKFPAPWGEQ